MSRWHKIRDNILQLTRDGDAWVTTLMDFYGLPEDSPGLQEALQPGNAHTKVLALQERFAQEIRHVRFIPFLALHEFEAWLFGAPDAIEAHFGRTHLAEKLRVTVKQAGSPELINHGATTHPKAQLRRLLAEYKETSDGPTLLEKIGIAAVRAACPHFDGWLQRLEGLGGATP